MIQFPFSRVRPGQSEMLSDVRSAFSEGKHLLAHAPTGIGKSAATVVPAVEYCLSSGANAFFLTPKHSQHRIVVDTLRLLREKSGAGINAVDLIGKRWMCPVDGARELSSRDFQDYCTSVRKDETCPYYGKTYKNSDLSVSAKSAVARIEDAGPLHAEEACEICANSELCPYEVMVHVAKRANFVICDYFHLFSEGVRSSFLYKTGKSLDSSILLVDEAHNLPSRLRSVGSDIAGEFMMSRAAREAEDAESELAASLDEMSRSFLELGKKIPEWERETLLKKEDLVGVVESGSSLSYDDFLSELEELAESVREKHRKSTCGALARFLKAWSGEDRGYARVLERSALRSGRQFLRLKYSCLDPAISASPVFTQVKASVLMSGTFSPMKMYSDILGLDPSKTVLRKYESPFPSGNRLNVIVPSVTTKFASRSDEEFGKIAAICAKTVREVPGSAAIFCPSYSIKEKISAALSKHLPDVTLLEERRGASKKERASLLHTVESSKNGILLGVSGGSFSEGVDYRKNSLKCVIIIGLPLEHPSLEVKALISYYDGRFPGRGWDYGYMFPAVGRAIQAAGRMIRSETDVGLAVFMDGRYTWKNYYKCFPPEMKFTVTDDSAGAARNFFQRISISKK